MAIKLNSNTEIVNTIKDGLKKQVVIVLAERKKQRIQNVCAKNLKSKLKIQILKGIVIVCFITKQLIKEEK